MTRVPKVPLALSQTEEWFSNKILKLKTKLKIFMNFSCN